MKKILKQIQKMNKQKYNKQYIIDYTIASIKNIDLLNTSVSELYDSVNMIQQNLKNIQ